MLGTLPTPRYHIDTLSQSSTILPIPIILIIILIIIVVTIFLPIYLARATGHPLATHIQIQYTDWA